MTDSEHLTERQLKAQDECVRAAEAYRIAWNGGRQKALMRLQKANQEKLAADVEAARISRMEQGHVMGAPV